jgi:biotin transport system substrate-specific component
MTSAAPATLVHAVSSRSESRNVGRAIRTASVVFFAVLTAASAQVSFPLPFTQVPFTLQPMVVLLAGLTLGAPLAFASQVLYLAAGIAGLPVWAASATLAPGALRLLGPTGGYLMSYPFAAFLTGRLAERGLACRYTTSILAMAAGLAVVYGFGVVWLGLFARDASGSVATGLGAAFVAGFLPFVVPDALKLAAAAGIVPSLWKLVGPRV